METALDPDRPGSESRFNHLQSLPGGALIMPRLSHPSTPLAFSRDLAENAYARLAQGLERRGAQNMLVSFSFRMKNASPLKETSKAAENKVRSYSTFHNPAR